jgi:hypothetical protein
MWQGLKPDLFFEAFCGTTEQLGEKVKMGVKLARFC